MIHHQEKCSSCLRALSVLMVVDVHLCLITSKNINPAWILECWDRGGEGGEILPYLLYLQTSADFGSVGKMCLRKKVTVCVWWCSNIEVKSEQGSGYQEDRSSVAASIACLQCALCLTFPVYKTELINPPIIYVLFWYQVSFQVWSNINY